MNSYRLVPVVGLALALQGHAQAPAGMDDLALPRGNFGDLNGDGKDDVLLRRADGAWLYYPMDGPRQAAGRGGANLTRDRNWRFAAAADFDGDGKADVLLRRRDGRWYYYPMDGRRSLPGRGTANLTRDLHWRFLGVGDFNGDGRHDVLLRHAEGLWRYYAMDGRRHLAESGELPLPADTSWRFAGIGDFGGDGRADVLLRHADGRWRYFPMHGQRVLDGGGYANLTHNPRWRLAGIADLDGDGRDDVLLRHADGRWFHYPMDGRRHIVGGRGFAGLPVDDAWRLAGLGDLNGDGRNDVLLRHADGRWHYYAMNGRRPASEAPANLTPRLDWRGVFADGAGAISTSGWLEGVFADAAGFKDRCAVPRQGLDAQGDPFPDRPGQMLDENNYLRSWSDDTYLWYDEIVDRDPACCTTLDYFDGLRTLALTPSGAPKDGFHFTEDTAAWERRVSSGVVGGYGTRFAVLASRPPRDVRVAYSEQTGPAAAAGLRRGARILAIDGVNVAYGAPGALNAGLFPRLGETHEFRVFDVGASAPRTVAMTAAEVASVPVLRTETIGTDADSVGYILFNSHIATAETGLMDAVAELAEAGVRDLVVDMRYNGGGYLAIANHLGYMVAGRHARGRVFSQTQFNDKHPYINPVTGAALSPRRFYETTTGWFDAAPDLPLPVLDLDRVFVIAGPGTCSASEAFLNGLLGIDVDVVLIGATTCGKPYGFYPVDNCGTTYSSIQFRSVNEAGFGDYADGFSPANAPDARGITLPGCAVADDFDRPLGDASEGRLAAALAFRRDGVCPPLARFLERRTAAARRDGARLEDPSPAARGEAILLPTEPVL